MDGHPGLRVGVEGVGGDGAGFAEGVEVVDQGEAAVLVAEAGDVENVLGFVEVVAVVAVGEELGVGIGGPGLVDVGDDLVSRGEYGEAVGLGGVSGGLLIALVAVEDADGDVEGEAYGVVRAVAVVVGFERWGRRCRWRRRA